MKYLKTFNALTIISTLLFFLLATRDTHAYIDPGTGSYLFQLIAAGLIGLAFTIKIYWRKVKVFLLELFRKKSE